MKVKIKSYQGTIVSMDAIVNMERIPTMDRPDNTVIDIPFYSNIKILADDGVFIEFTRVLPSEIEYVGV